MQRASRRAASPANARAYLAHDESAPTFATGSPRSAARTLVLHREQNVFVPRRLGRYVARAHRGRAVRAWCRGRPRAVDGVLGRSARRDRGVPDRAAARVRGPGADDGALHRHRRLDPTRGRAGRRGVARRAGRARRDRARRSSAASAGGRSTRRATASSRRSMHRPQRGARRDRDHRGGPRGGVRGARRRPHG